VKKSSLTLWITRLAWGLLSFDLLLIFIVPTDTNIFDSLLLMIAYAGWLILTSIIASTWLIIRYRAFFHTWPGWAVPLILLILSSLVVQNVLFVSHSNLSLFFAMLFLTSVWSVGVATAILLWYRDIGLGLMAWGLAIFIWVVLLTWRFQGNSIELVLSSLNHPNEPSPLWWFNPLICIFGWIIPLGIVSFLGHTLRLIIREWR
jgi:hypothetical protein